MKPVTMRFVLLLLTCGLFSVDAFAQYTQTNDMEGRPVHEYSTINMQGSPYLYPDFAQGTILLKNGTIYQGINMMYDQVKDVIVFKGKDGKVKELMEPVQEFKINFIQNNQATEKTFRRGFSGDRLSPEAYLEVLADGNTVLLKRTTKKIFDRKNYSSATINREVQEAEDYYVATGNKVVKVKKTKSSLLAAMPDKADYLESYIKSNSLILRNDSDMAKLVAYYNTL
ncbi:hypothetical protein H9Q13_08665 [Pontibacter sp. JH31]|uniref:DUF4369 domain-containing protein n=1 Tax=Pontibacter aquaedesilientis TaxID=2766980 RepID=A0ABR7XG14_9BACT|nr:hypothetical protein [Pontibacter aquaedesilientis]MBD1397234.1 hypothetical protein [Pontibacter aquaedesilientis]